jgi:hypothetical protein
MKSAEAFIELIELGISPAEALESLPNYNPFNFTIVPPCSVDRDAWFKAVPETVAHD